LKIKALDAYVIIARKHLMMNPMLVLTIGNIVTLSVSLLWDG